MSALPYEPVIFVAKTKTENQNFGNRNVTKKKLSGDVIRSLYEETVGLTSASCSETPQLCTNSPCSTTRTDEKQSDINICHVQQQQEESDPFKLMRINQQLLGFAQNGDVSKLKFCLQKGADINHSDQYGWTGLMCASYSGMKDVIEVLLHNKCDTSLTNNKKQTAYDLAMKNKHYSITRMIENHYYSVHVKQEKCDSDPETVLFCPICRLDFTSDECEHNISTVHQINSSNKTMEVNQYKIPETNAGFQIMLKTGWDKNHGLGSVGHQGQKFPVRTVFKKDRKGVGFGASKRAKVTHFTANDDKAIEGCTRLPVELKPEMTNKQRQKRLRVKRQKEINFRNEFNICVE